MKEICKVLAWIELILGGIGSIIIAKDYGYGYSSYRGIGRDWVLTFSIFFGLAFSVAVISVALFAISEILDNQEKIIRNQKIGTVAGTGDDTTSNLGNITSVTTQTYSNNRVSNSKTGAEWICPNCGRKNASYVGTCGCGTSKSSL